MQSRCLRLLLDDQDDENSLTDDGPWAHLTPCSTASGLSLLRKTFTMYLSLNQSSVLVS